MLDLRIQPLPPETLAAQRPAVEPARPAVAPAASASEGNGSGGATNNGATGNGGTETPRDQYVSPFITIDPTSGLVITQYRNSATGELQQQYPSEKVVREYRNMQPPAVTPSGGRAAAAPGQPGSGQPAETGGQGDVVTIGRVASAGGQGSPAPVPTAPVPTAPAQAAPAAPAPAPVPTGGVDKGSA